MAAEPTPVELINVGHKAAQYVQEGGRGEGARRFQKKRVEQEEFLKYAPVEPWSIINFMPFPLNVSGVIHERLRGEGGHQVPPAPLAIPDGWQNTPDFRYGTTSSGIVYSHKIIRDMQWSARDEGASADNIENFSPVPHLPKTIAEDFGNEYISNMGWGVMIYPGDHEPTTPGMKHKLQEALTVSNRMLMNFYDVGNALHSAGDTKAIKNNPRDAARMLLHRKVIKSAPPWLTVAEPEAQDFGTCPGCGDTPTNKILLCPKCPYVYDPVAAYMAKLIDYGHISMDGMDTSQWKQVNAEKARRDKNKAAAEKG
jgi:hypothetical protein